MPTLVPFLKILLESDTLFLVEFERVVMEIVSRPDWPRYRALAVIQAEFKRCNGRSTSPEEWNVIRRLYAFHISQAKELGLVHNTSE